MIDVGLLAMKAENLAMSVNALGFLPQPRSTESAVGQLDIGEIIEGAGDAMQTGGSFSEVSSKVDSIGGGAYHIAYKVGIFAALFAIIVVAIQLMFANANERQEKKSRLIWVIVAATLLMGACALLLFISSLSNGMFG